MTFRAAAIFPLALLAAVSCRRDHAADGPALPPSDAALRKAETPILPLRPGDSWTYHIRLFIPAGATSPGSAEVETSHPCVRTYLGKLAPATGLPDTDCFELRVPGSPDEREFVEIRADRILLRGSLVLRPETTRPLWFDTPVPFVIAGLPAGSVLPDVEVGEGALFRRSEVIAREAITVPAGRFHAIRLLTTGHDGGIDLRRTIWFTPRVGIVREEKSRQQGDTLLFHEIRELTAITGTPAAAAAAACDRPAPAAR